VVTFVYAGGFPILNSFVSASDAPINASSQGSAGNSDDSRCGRGCLGRDSFANAAAAVGPAVVNISCMHGENVTAMEMVNYLPVSLALVVKLVQLLFVETHGWALEKSIGSGTIIDPDGTILTCAHVVADFQSTKAVLRGKVINLALPVPSVLILSCPLRTGSFNTITNGTIMMHECLFLKCCKLKGLPRSTCWCVQKLSSPDVEEFGKNYTCKCLGTLCMD
jgi:hypothetical protein